MTEPNTGLDTLKLQSLATRDGSDYVLKGSKIWTSTAQVAEKILILVRTTPLEEVKKPSEGLTLFYTDLDRSQVSVTEIKKMGRAAVDTNSLYFDGWRVPAADRIGAEGDGFKCILHGMNAERILLSGEAVGIGYAALRHATRYARERVVFGRPIGQNQAIQHPLARSWCQLESTRLMLCRLRRCGMRVSRRASMPMRSSIWRVRMLLRLVRRRFAVWVGWGTRKSTMLSGY